MPAGFDACQKAGGSIKTISGPSKHYGLGKGEYMHVCVRKGEWHRGEVKKKSKPTGNIGRG